MLDLANHSVNISISWRHWFYGEVVRVWVRGCSGGGTVSSFVFWESVLDDALVDAVFLGLCYWSEIVDDVLLEALFLGLCSGSQSLMMLLWRHCL